MLPPLLYTSRPSTGDEMGLVAFTNATLGISNPLLVLLTSSIAEPSGEAPVEFIPTFCALREMNDAVIKYKSKKYLVKFLIISDV